MSKRQGGAAPPPPLPPGPQPQHDAAAIHAAAWQQYYVGRRTIAGDPSLISLAGLARDHLATRSTSRSTRLSAICHQRVPELWIRAGRRDAWPRDDGRRDEYGDACCWCSREPHVWATAAESGDGCAGNADAATTGVRDATDGDTRCADATGDGDASVCGDVSAARGTGDAAAATTGVWNATDADVSATSATTTTTDGDGTRCGTRSTVRPTRSGNATALRRTWTIQQYPTSRPDDTHDAVHPSPILRHERRQTTTRRPGTEPWWSSDERSSRCWREFPAGEKTKDGSSARANGSTASRGSGGTAWSTSFRAGAGDPW